MSQQQTLRELFAKHNQGHVFQFYEQLNTTEQEEFLQQLKEIPIENLHDIFQQSMLQLQQTQSHESILPPAPQDIDKLSTLSSEEQVLLNNFFVHHFVTSFLAAKVI